MKKAESDDERRAAESGAEPQTYFKRFMREVRKNLLGGFQGINNSPPNYLFILMTRPIKYMQQCSRCWSRKG